MRGEPVGVRLLRATKQGPGCWEWRGAVGTNGYGRIGHKGRVLQAHRVSWALFYGIVPADLWVLHRCDNRLCVRPDHLFLGDRQANVSDCVAKGRHVFGARSNLARLTADRAARMRDLWKTGRFTQRQLAQEFKVTQSNVHHVVSGKTWKQE